MVRRCKDVLGVLPRMVICSAHGDKPLFFFFFGGGYLTHPTNAVTRKVNTAPTFQDVFSLRTETESLNHI